MSGFEMWRAVLCPWRKRHLYFKMMQFSIEGIRWKNGTQVFCPIFDLQFRGSKFVHILIHVIAYIRLQMNNELCASWKTFYRTQCSNHQIKLSTKPPFKREKWKDKKSRIMDYFSIQYIGRLHTKYVWYFMNYSFECAVNKCYVKPSALHRIKYQNNST